MKTLSIVPILALLVASQSAAQTPQSTPDDGQTQMESTLAIVERGMNHRVWQRVLASTNALGGTQFHTNSYTELATGMHYQKSGQWMESQARIDILPDGTAAATQGIHQVYFPNDLAQGIIELVTPEGQHLQSRPLGLSYDDVSNTVLIAELKSSEGHLVGSNQVVYPDAFTDFKADVRYTYTRAGFEQDIILREQPPGPEEYQLSPESTRLQVLTEFFNTPEPTKRNISRTSQSTRLPDEDLAFGPMRLMPGKAFTLEEDSEPLQPASVHTRKQWLNLEGRSFLMEEVDLSAAQEALEKLPETGHASVSPIKDSVRHLVSNKRLIPKTPKLNAARSSNKRMQLAQAAVTTRPGYVLDYQTYYETSDVFFRGDTTYYINDSFFCAEATIEGGTVVKFDPVNSTYLGADLIHCQTAAYRPAIFTSMNDNSVGEIIADSTGTPTGGGTYLSIHRGVNLAHLRMAYCSYGITFYDVYEEGPLNLTDVQFTHVGSAVLAYPGDYNFRNVLIADAYIPFYLAGGSVRGEHLTIESCTSLIYGSPGTLALTNSLLVNVATSGGAFTSVNNATNTGSGIFQTVGAGSYYLANGSPYRNTGTTNINADLLADLRMCTTYPPIVYYSQIITNDTVLSPQAQRDTDLPDLGYHYQPLDYAFGTVRITNATITVLPGTVIATFSAGNTYGLGLLAGSKFHSRGTPTEPNWIVRYHLVQEQSTLNWTNSYYDSSILGNWQGGTSPEINCRFTKWSAAGGANRHFGDLYQSMPIGFTDCEFYGGQFVITRSSLYLTNCLFDRVYIGLSDDSGPRDMNIRNGNFYGGKLELQHWDSGNFLFRDNLFDQTTITQDGDVDNAYDGYTIGTTRLTPTNAYDVVSNLTYQTGALGQFYQLTNSVFINVGSVTNAGLVGLYHYAVTTNLTGGLQIKETNSIVDIGYHYVALNSSGNPIDTDGDDLPDYFEDTDGNGTYETGDLANWTSSDTDGDGVNDGVEVVQGRNPTVAGTATDTSNLIRIQVYTPLK